MCKTDGCNCRDTRIVNRRIARFVRARRPDATAYRDPSTLTAFDVPDYNPDMSEAIQHRLVAIGTGVL